MINQGMQVIKTGSGDSERAPSYKKGKSPTEDQILFKADEMKKRGLTGYCIAKTMRHEQGFENVATTAVRDLIKGRYRGGRSKERTHNQTHIITHMRH